jgi:hypothetical protein
MAGDNELRIPEHPSPGEALHDRTRTAVEALAGVVGLHRALALTVRETLIEDADRKSRVRRRKTVRSKEATNAATNNRNVVMRTEAAGERAGGRSREDGSVRHTPLHFLVLTQIFIKTIYDLYIINREARLF